MLYGLENVELRKYQELFFALFSFDKPVEGATATEKKTTTGGVELGKWVKNEMGLYECKVLDDFGKVVKAFASSIPGTNSPML